MLKPSQSFFVYRIQSEEKNLQKKSFLRKKGKCWIEKKKTKKTRKEGFLTALATTIKKDPTMSKRKHANELKVHGKIVRTAIKQDWSPDLNLLDYAIWGVLENKTNATSHSNIGSLKIAINEEFILKACKSFPKRVDTIIKKKKMMAILSKFTVLCLSTYFLVYFLNQN